MIRANQLDIRNAVMQKDIMPERRMEMNKREETKNKKGGYKRERKRGNMTMSKKKEKGMVRVDTKRERVSQNAHLRVKTKVNSYRSGKANCEQKRGSWLCGQV